MIHRFDLEIRILIEQPLEGIHRVTCLEIDHCLTTTDGWQFAAKVLHDVIEHECKAGDPPFREAPDGLLFAWNASDYLEQSTGASYKGSLSRIIHILTQRTLEPGSNQFSVPNIEPQTP